MTTNDGKPQPLDTSNRFGVTAHNGKVVTLVGWVDLTPDEALQLAAWLIVGAELADRESALEVTAATVEAIRAT